MRTKALWRKYRRIICRWADYALYACGAVCTLFLFWLLLQFSTVAHFVVPTGSMEPTLILGDNVLSSQDSRYWGLLPEEYIVGKATRIFRSVNKHTGKERWRRMMKKIK